MGLPTVFAILGIGIPAKRGLLVKRELYMVWRRADKAIVLATYLFVHIMQLNIRNLAPLQQWKKPLLLL